MKSANAFCAENNLEITNYGNGSERVLVNELSSMPGSHREAFQS